MKVIKASQKGLDLIKRFEGLELKPYKCPAGIPTIGYGNTYYPSGSKVKLTDPVITKEKAEELLKFLLGSYEKSVDSFCRDDISQNQFDALVDFAYNAGTKALLTSKLLIKLNAGKYVEASQEFPKWVYAGGKKLPGLVRRREAEKELFLS